MKELSIEEKARAYDKALAIAKEQLNGAKVFDYDNEQVAHDIRTTVYNILPELKESEDERIRKRIITLVKAHGQGMYKDEMIAWLEKQREQETIETSEHKYNIGDWIIAPELPPTSLTIAKVVYIFDEQYVLEYLDGTKEVIEINKVDNTYFRWTIEDAKEGDVLAVDWYQGDDSWEKIIIFKKYHNKGVEGLIHTPCVEGYGNTFKNGKMAFDEEVPYYSKTWTANLHPATKEQHEFLFTKMKEDGYEWDADKKELIKL